MYAGVPHSIDWTSWAPLLWYFKMMACATAYQLMALKQLKHQILLVTLSPSVNPPKQPKPNKKVKHQHSADTTGCAYPVAQQCKEWTPPTANLLYPKPWPEPSLSSPSPALPETVCLTPPTTQSHTLKSTPSHSNRCSHQPLICQTKGSLHPLAYPHGESGCQMFCRTGSALPVSSEQRCGMFFIISYDDNGFSW